ncbi:hypothetical protein HFO14_30480 [Rhizobium laguerreae]|nr:hypothetical protein [Rhizobium laguerreae]
MHAFVAHFCCRSEVKCLRRFKQEHAEVRRIAADLSLDKAMLQDVLSRRFSGLPVGANFVDQVRVIWYIWQTTGAAPLKPKTRPWNDQGGGRETLISR